MNALGAPSGPEEKDAGFVCFAAVAVRPKQEGETWNSLRWVSG